MTNYSLFFRMNGRLKSKLLKLLWIQNVIISQPIPAPELSRHPVRIRYLCPYSMNHTEFGPSMDWVWTMHSMDHTEFLSIISVCPHLGVYVHLTLFEYSIWPWLLLVMIIIIQTWWCQRRFYNILEPPKITWWQLFSCFSLK